MASGTMYLTSDRARRLTQSSIGTKSDPIFLDSSGRIAQCTSADDTSIQYIRARSGSFQTRIQTASTNGGLYIADEDSIQSSSIRLLNFNKSTFYYYLGEASVVDTYGVSHSTSLYIYPSTTINNNVFIQSGYDIYMYAPAGSSSGSSCIYFTQSTGSTIAPTGTGTQYRSVNVFPVKITADLPYFKTAYTDGVAGTEEVGSSNVAINFTLNSVNSTTLANTGYHEEYYLMASTDRTSHGTYRIHSTKYAITVAQGGTGKTSWTSGRFIYSSAATTLANSTIGTDGSNLLFNFLSPVDLAATDNGGATYSRSIRFYDSTGTYQAGLLQTTVNADGSTEIKMFAGNNVSSSQKWYGITINAKKDGTITYSVGGAAAFRTAIGVGTAGTRADSYFALASHTHSYLPLSGGTMTGNITLNSSGVHIQRTGISTSWIYGRNVAPVKTTSYSGYDAIFSMKTTAGDWSCGVYTNNILYFTYTPDTQYNSNTNSGYTQVYITSAAVLMGAAWNDYAEYRQSDFKDPGYIVQENDNGCLSRTEERLIPGASVISDTFGYAEGKTEKADTPIAVSGRVLVYTYRNRSEYHAGMAVCSAPGGTIDIMTREEIMMHPDCIVGIVSEIPDYETWGTGNVNVDGRIWIKVK